MLRLQLLASNRDRDESGVLKAAQDYVSTVTKGSDGFSPTLIDSMIFGQATKAGNDPLFIYVVSNGQGNGFTLVNKDSRLTPVLGYSESGTFASGDHHPGFDILMENIAAEQTYLRDSIERLADDDISQQVQRKLGLISDPTKGADPEDRPPGPPAGVLWDRFEIELDRTWYQTDYSAGPLLKTKWGQGYPYNSWRSDGYPAGCTATSAAQIMAYYKYPSRSPLTDLPYYWTSYMPTSGGSWSSMVADNIGQLMRDLGSRSCLDITYNDDGSGAKCWNTPRTFEIFGYYGGSHGKYNAGQLRNDILINKRPVHIDGESTSGPTGHTWVVDGYQEQSYWEKTYTVFYYQGTQVYTISNSPSIKQVSVVAHHNFGWDGNGNGWFVHSDPTFRYKNMEMILNIRPRL